jgi:hypothetical protein
LVAEALFEKHSGFHPGFPAPVAALAQPVFHNLERCHPSPDK